MGAGLSRSWSLVPLVGDELTDLADGATVVVVGEPEHDVVVSLAAGERRTPIDLLVRGRGVVRAVPDRPDSQTRISIEDINHVALRARGSCPGEGERILPYCAEEQVAEGAHAVAVAEVALAVVGVRILDIERGDLIVVVLLLTKILIRIGKEVRRGVAEEVDRAALPLRGQGTVDPVAEQGRAVDGIPVQINLDEVAVGGLAGGFALEPRLGSLWIDQVLDRLVGIRLLRASRCFRR